MIHIYIYSFSSLSYDRSEASSKASSPHSVIQSFLFQKSILSFLKVIIKHIKILEVYIYIYIYTSRILICLMILQPISFYVSLSLLFFSPF